MADWYTGGAVPPSGGLGASAPIRGEYAALAAAFAKMPALAGHGGEIVRVNAGGTALESISALTLASIIAGTVTTVDDANSNSPSNVVVLRHSTTGTPAVGIGTGVGFETETSAGIYKVGSTLQSIASNVGSGVEAFDIVLNTMVAGALVEKFRLLSTGVLNLAALGALSIGGASVLSATTLGTGVVNSSLTSFGAIPLIDINGGTIDGTLIGATTRAAGLFTTVGLNSVLTAMSGSWGSGGIDLTTGSDFKINGVSKLTATTLGSAVVNSSLTSVGTIATGVWQGTPIAAGYVADLSGTNTGDEVTATDTVEGVVELATNAEAATGTATDRALVPANASSLNVGKVLGVRIEVLGLVAYNASAKAADTLYFINGP